MKPQQTALIISIGFFLSWLAILYAGADHPPPPGFLLVVLADLVAAVVVYVRVPTYIRWARTGVKLRWLRALLDGAIAGLVLVGFFILLPTTGEPTVQPSFFDRLIGFLVVGVIGAVNALAIYWLSAFLGRERTPKQ